MDIKNTARMGVVVGTGGKGVKWDEVANPGFLSLPVGTITK